MEDMNKNENSLQEYQLGMIFGVPRNIGLLAICN